MMAAVGKPTVLWQTALVAEETVPVTTQNASLSIDYTGALRT